MTNRMLLFVFALILCSRNFARAGEGAAARENSEGWASIGIGTGAFGPTIYGSVSYTVNSSRIAVRYWKADEFNFNPGGADFDLPALSCREYGILYGRTFWERNLELSGSAGVAYVKGVDRGAFIKNHDYDPVHISTIGIPFEARFRFDLGFLGLGGAWYGNVNSMHSSSGAMLELSLKLFEE